MISVRKIRRKKEGPFFQSTLLPSFFLCYSISFIIAQKEGRKVLSKKEKKEGQQKQESMTVRLADHLTSAV
jgi:hypothetical protein